jgi:hypothetical protein
MPHVRRAVAAGTLSMDHVDLLCRYATVARQHLFERDEALLVAQLSGLQLFDDCRRLVRYWADKADDELSIEQHEPLPSALYAARTADDGSLHLQGRLTAVHGEIVANELDRLARQIRLEDRAAKVSRTPAQRRAEALARMAARSAAADGPALRPLFEVIVGDETARRLCELASGAVVRARDLVPYIDTAVMQSFLFDGPHTIVSMSKRRTFTGALRRAIQVRDRHCQHPSGCPVPGVHCDIDHRTPAARGGPTSQFNGEAKCSPHNRDARLHDDPEPRPEQHIDILTYIRAVARWASRRLDADEAV